MESFLRSAKIFFILQFQFSKEAKKMSNANLFPADVQKWTVKEWAIIGGAVAFLLLIIIIIAVSARAKKTYDTQALANNRRNMDYILGKPSNNEKPLIYGQLPAETAPNAKQSIYASLPPQANNPYSTLPNSAWKNNGNTMIQDGTIYSAAPPLKKDGTTYDTWRGNDTMDTSE